MKRILVPTDFSKQAEVALKVAGFMAAKNDSEIYILHSIEMPMYLASVSKGAVPESIFYIKLAENKFEELLEKPYLEDIEVHEAIGHGEVHKDINEAVEQRGIDLIIIGSHGVSGLKEMFIGSNTQNVVSSANVPVMVIKNNHETFNIDNFIYLSDFSEDCITPIKKAHKFAQKIGTTINFLYVNTPSHFTNTAEMNKKMEDIINNLGIQDYTLNIFNDKSVEKGVYNFAKETNANLIGLGTHGRKGFLHFFNSNIGEDIVNHAKMPVVTFRY